VRATGAVPRPIKSGFADLEERGVVVRGVGELLNR
jgi:hypothetical protein